MPPVALRRVRIACHHGEESVREERNFFSVTSGNQSPEQHTGGDDRLRFQELYCTYYRPLLKLCRRQLGRNGDAEGVVQDVFSRAWAARRRLDQDRPVWPWLSTIARRLCINENIRSRRRLDRLTRLRGQQADPTMIDDEVDRHSISEAVVDALACLSPRQRRVFFLREVEGWSYRDIAAFEGVTVDSVRGLLRRARAVFDSMAERSRRAGLAATLLLQRFTFPRRGRGRAGERWAWFAGSRLAGPEGAALLALLLLPAHPPTAAPVTSTAAVAAPAASWQPSGSSPVETARDAPIEEWRVDSAGVDHSVPSGPPPVTAAATADDRHAPDDPYGYRFTASPSYEVDGTVFAAGRTNRCGHGIATCPVLLRSSDRARTWTRLDAAGVPDVEIQSILLPPSYPRDNRLFAVSEHAVSVSEDGGRTFALVAPVNGAVAMSPLFSDGDPRLLVAANNTGVSLPVVMEYRDDLRVLRPFRLPLPVNAVPLAFGFGPDYHVDRRILVSVVEHADPAAVQAGLGSRTAVYSCTASSCTRALSGPIGPAARVASAPSHPGRGPVLVAWSGTQAHRSTDGGVSFHPIAPLMGPRGLQTVRKVTADGRGRLFAATWSTSDGLVPSLFSSDDHGDTWAPVAAFERAVVADVLALPGNTVLASRITATGASVACSMDGGRTWEAACA